MLVPRNGHMEIVQMLIKSNVNVNAKNIHGITAIMSASSFGHIEIVKMLLRAGASTSIEDDDGLTVLNYATSGNHKEVLEILTQTDSFALCVIS